MASMDDHPQTQQRRSGQVRPLPQPLSLHIPKEYRVAFPRIATYINCLYEGCPGGVNSRTNLRLYFLHRHVEYTILALNKGPDPHSQ